MRAEFRRILIGMGFAEMPTSRWVESSFWNFDSLFQPQSHPARDAHDTFFIKNPAATLRVPEDYYERVKSTHQVCVRVYVYALGPQSRIVSEEK